MKLISLNVDRGAHRESFLEFLKAKRDDTDVFCFQEVINGGEKELTTFWNDEKRKTWNLLTLIEESLPGHTSFFRPHVGDWAGLATLVRKDVPVMHEGEVFVFGNSRIYPGSPEWKPPAPRNIQYIGMSLQGKDITVINFHGLWDKTGKGDTEQRITQSQNIILFAKSISGDFVLCGDFNLLPDTESIHMLEEELHLGNLIREYGITSTRTPLFPGPEKFADYILTTAGINVRDFKVLQDVVSDHAPLFLEFD